MEPSQKRAASVIALEDSVVAKLTEPQFAELGNKYPDIYKKKSLRNYRCYYNKETGSLLHLETKLRYS